MKPDCAVFDIDGTLADTSAMYIKYTFSDDMSWEDLRKQVAEAPPIIQTLELCTYLQHKHKCFFVTGRKESDRDITEAWLQKYELLKDPRDLFMFEENPAKMNYITFWKLDTIREQIEPNFSVKGIFEDDLDTFDALRFAGYTVYYVNKGLQCQ